MEPSEILSRHPLFASFEKEELRARLLRSGAYEESFAPGEAIPLCRRGAARIGFLLEGGASVTSRGATLNRLIPGSCFGVAHLYAPPSDFPTRVEAKTACRALFLDEAALDPMLSDPRFAKNLVSFLSDRIRFLNRKIAAFTAPDATVRLAFVLLHRAADGKEYAPAGSFSALAKELDLGRASLYRAIDALVKAGVIEKDGKTIHILDKSKLKQITERR